MNARPRCFESCDSGDQDQWLVSYADMISAILVVLMLMFSFTKIDMAKVDALHKLNGQQERISTLFELKHRFEKLIESHGLQHHVALKLDDQGLHVYFQNVAWFGTDSARIEPEQVRPFLPLFRALIDPSRLRRIDIEGHTDDVGDRLHNWALSSRRALAFFTYLKQLGVEDTHMRLIAYGETAPLKPVEGLTGDALNQARSENRRVSVHIGEVVSGN